MEEIKQMEISYHREMKNNYLMIAVEEARERGFEARMLIGNTIDGLLKFRIRKSDNRCQFCYEITSKQPLGRLLETKAIGADQIRRLLLGIAQTLTRMEDYLLSEDQILLDPDFIYVDLENFQPGLCLIPGRKGDFPQEFSELLRFLLGKVDHQDKDAVVLVYGLYRESLKDNYGLDNLLRWLVKEDCSNHENEKSEPAMEKTSQDLLVATDVPEQRKETVFIKPEFPIKKILIYSCIIPIIFICFWLRDGREGVYLIATSGVLGGAVLISIAGISLWIWKWRKNSHNGSGKTGRQKTVIEEDSGQPETVHTSWEMVFDDEPENSDDTEVPDEDNTHTVLLWSCESKEKQRQLIPENQMVEPVTIAYYPFLLGKQEDLVDYVLREETVSRLHVRIDRAGEEYFLTDLNSTNGTTVNGRKLETNETVKLSIGDQVGIARLSFYFR